MADRSSPAEVAGSSGLRRRQLPQPGILLALVSVAVFVGVHWIIGIGLTSVSAFYYVSISQRLDAVDSFLDDFQLYLSPLIALNLLLFALAVPWLAYGREMPRLLGWRGLSGQQWAWVMLSVVPLGVLTAELRHGLSHLFARLELEGLGVSLAASPSFEKYTPQGFALVLIVGCVLTAVTEEFYCRGFLGRGLIARCGAVCGTLIVSLLFAAMHLDLIQGMTAFLLGIALQFLYLTTRSLWAPIAAHMLHNAFALCLLQFGDQYPVPGLTPMPSALAGPRPAWLPLAALMTLVCLVWLIFQTRTQWKRPDGSVWSPGYVSAERPPRGLLVQAVSARPQGWLVAVCLAGFSCMIAAAITAHSLVSG